MKKNNILIGVIALVFIFVSLTMIVANRKTTKKDIGVKPTAQPEVIPTIDSSVQVSLVSKNNKRAVELTIDAIPKGTTSIEYSLEYQARQQGLQGIIGTLETKEGVKKEVISRELGTCSSGACVFHDVVGAVKVGLKFNGSYGERIFEKDFDL